MTSETIELYNKIYDQKIQELNLNNNQITNVCHEIGQLQNLHILSLNCNYIQQICPEIGQLQNLQSLYLYENKITNVCSEIGQLKNLQLLNLSINEITQMCPEIGQLQNLQTLYLCINQITLICPEIGQLQNLRVLDLNDNLISNVCPEIGQLRNLHELNLWNNKITYMCPEIGQLQNLHRLYFDNNQITNICSEIGQLQKLQELYVNNNQITIIPTNIIMCNDLISIEYHGNNIEHYVPCVQRFLDRIRNAGGTIINIYNDRQNVHTSSIQTSVRNSIFNLLNHSYNLINKTNEMNGINSYIEDLVLTPKTKQLITEYISIKETHSRFDCTFEEIFRAVWCEIFTLQIGFQNEVKKRLNEEMDDSEYKCYTGRISRLVNCLSGYSDKVLIQISDAEQIGNIISFVRSKYEDSHEDSHNDSSIDTIKQIVKNELTERKFDQSVIEEWVSYID